MRKILLVLTAAAAISPASLPGHRHAPDSHALVPDVSELIFPLEHWHNHASMVVELPAGTC